MEHLVGTVDVLWYVRTAAPRVLCMPCEVRYRLESSSVQYLRGTTSRWENRVRGSTSEFLRASRAHRAVHTSAAPSKYSEASTVNLPLYGVSWNIPRPGIAPPHVLHCSDADIILLPAMAHRVLGALPGRRARSGRMQRLQQYEHLSGDALTHQCCGISAAQ